MVELDSNKGEVTGPLIQILDDDSCSISFTRSFPIITLYHNDMLLLAACVTCDCGQEFLASMVVKGYITALQLLLWVIVSSIVCLAHVLNSLMMSRMMVALSLSLVRLVS